MVRLLRGFRALVLVSAGAVTVASCGGKSVDDSALPRTAGAAGGGSGANGFVRPTGGSSGSLGFGATGGVGATGGTGASGGVGATGGTGARGGVGATGGTGATGAVGATPGTGGATPVAGSGGSAGASDLCALPPDGGNCDALIPQYYFDVVSGQCLAFDYGGCGGNDNRFDNRGECLARCAGGEDRTRCSDPSECTLVAAECCGCSQGLNDVAAVSKSYDEAFPGILTCPEILCPVCEEPPSPYLFATCEQGSEETGYCAGYDARQLHITECVEDSDCRLRRGLGCCECSGEIVSVNVTVDIEAFTCGSGGCTADCDPGFPALTVPVCLNGRCDVTIE